MIDLRGIAKTYNQGQATEVRALEPLDLTIAKGTFAVVIGGNGSGKSTLLDIVSGAVQPSSGLIAIAGRDVTGVAEHRRSQWIARVFQNPLAGTASELSILDNFRLAALRSQAKKLVIGIDDAFKRRVQDQVARLGLGLENKLHQPMGTPSGGQRQALTLVMGVMDRADILLLDEPTAALDPNSARIVLATAQSLIAEHHLTALLVTHNLADARQLGNRLLHIDRGRIVRDLNSEEKSQVELEAMFTWFGQV